MTSPSLPNGFSRAPRDLTLALKAEYFDAIKAGTKPDEFRLQTDYWRKRLVGRTYDRVVLTKGYPRSDDLSRRIERKWRGYKETVITHPHFGSAPVPVFAIDVTEPIPTPGDAVLKELAEEGG